MIKSTEEMAKELEELRAKRKTERKNLKKGLVRITRTTRASVSNGSYDATDGELMVEVRADNESIFYNNFSIGKTDNGDHAHSVCVDLGWNETDLNFSKTEREISIVSVENFNKNGWRGDCDNDMSIIEGDNGYHLIRVNNKNSNSTNYFDLMEEIK